MENTNSPRPRSLSKTEARLVSYLEFERQPLVTVDQASGLLGYSYLDTDDVLRSLVRKGWLVRLRPGLFQLVPAAHGGYSARDWFVLLQAFRTPYYLSFLSAAYLLGLSPQRPWVAQVATPKLVRARYATPEQGVEQVLMREPRFFGFGEMEREGLTIKVAEPAKTVVDCLYHVEKAGGILEVARIVARGVEQAANTTLVEYAIRMKNRALTHRLGYLTDTLGSGLRKTARSRLLRHVSSHGQQHSFLGSIKTFGTKGEYDRTWRITDNVGRERLLGELEY
jgi:predicted transcriptional regulator of viral defense system